MTAVCLLLTPLCLPDMTDFRWSRCTGFSAPKLPACSSAWAAVTTAMLNMTYVALASSRFVNGVAMQHGKISREMFPDYAIDAITNGVHAATWTAPPMQAIFDRSIPRWRKDNFQFRYAIDIPLREIEKAHAQSKRNLIDAVAERTGITLRSNVFTIGFRPPCGHL